MIKKSICVIMVVATLFTMFAFSASAATSKTVYTNTSRQWSSDVKCSLTALGKLKGGSVRVYVQQAGVNVDIRMRNGSKTIWSQNNAINCGNVKRLSAQVYRDFSLGKNYSYYNLSFRTSKACYCAPYVTVTSLKNVKVS